MDYLTISECNKKYGIKDEKYPMLSSNKQVIFNSYRGKYGIASVLVTAHYNPKEKEISIRKRGVHDRKIKDKIKLNIEELRALKAFLNEVLEDE